jgi:hypothetical protein
MNETTQDILGDQEGAAEEVIDQKPLSPFDLPGGW